MNTRNNLRDDAVFEGGGVKGIGLVGVIAVAEDRGYKWVSVAGTSAGLLLLLYLPLATVWQK
jgi:NTE family protein